MSVWCGRQLGPGGFVGPRPADGQRQRANTVKTDSSRGTLSRCAKGAPSLRKGRTGRPSSVLTPQVLGAGWGLPHRRVGGGLAEVATLVLQCKPGAHASPTGPNQPSLGRTPFHQP